MSIASEIEDLQSNLESAKSAVVAKGGTVGDTGLGGLTAEIESIPSGGGFNIDTFLQNQLYGMSNIDAFRLQENMVYIGYTVNGYTNCTLLSSGLDFFPTSNSYADREIQLFGVEDMGPMTKGIVDGIKQVLAESGTFYPGAIEYCLQYDDRNQTWWGWATNSGSFIEITPQKMEEFRWRENNDFWFAPNSEKKIAFCPWGLPDGYYSQYFVLIRFMGGESLIDNYSDMNYAEVDAETFKNEIFPQLFGNSAGSNLISLPGRNETITTITTSQISYIVIGDGVADADLPQFPSGGAFFMANSQYLALFYGLNRILTHSGELALGEGFLYYCWRFNQPIDLTNVRRIGLNFMQSCLSFNQKLVIPENVEFETFYNSYYKKYSWYFMSNLFNMCSEVEVNSPPCSEELYFDSTLCANAGPALTRGIKITGLYRDAWLAKLPNIEGRRNLY